jgi:hypothetical protein
VENINHETLELELLEHPFGEVSFTLANEEVRVGIPSYLVRSTATRPMPGL